MATALLTSGCSDWFDVSPKTDIKAEELFTTENGFRSALAGLYISMTDDDAYGDNLSFGMLDQMAQLYDMIPDGTTSRDAIYIYDVHTNGYDTKTKLERSWLKAYNIIANCNNLLKWLDANGAEVTCISTSSEVGDRSTRTTAQHAASLTALQPMPAVSRCSPPTRWHIRCSTTSAKRCACFPMRKTSVSQQTRNVDSDSIITQ